MQRKKAPERLQGLLDLRLFVAGSSELSLRTIDSVKRACEKYAPGRYRLSIVDIYLEPEAAAREQVVAVPTLIQRSPAPVRMFVGAIYSLRDLDRPFSCLPAVG